MKGENTVVSIDAEKALDRIQHFHEKRDRNRRLP